MAAFPSPSPAKRKWSDSHLVSFNLFFFFLSMFYCVLVFGVEMLYGMCVHQRTCVFGVEMRYVMCAHQRAYVFGVEMHHAMCAHQRTCVFGVEICYGMCAHQRTA